MYKKLIASLSLIIPIFGVGLMSSYGERACLLPAQNASAEERGQSTEQHADRVYQAWCGGIF